MDFKSVKFIEDKAILEEVKNFDIKQILECGQCFRWDKISDTDYIVVAFGRVIEITQKGNEVTIHNTNEEDFNNIWLHYFDLETNYDEIKDNLSKDEILRESIKYGYGIRILNQDPFEMLISFIISARNSIPSIKKTVKKICEKWGDKIVYKGNEYYTFPTPEQISSATLEEIQETGASFRSKYIVDTIKKVNEALEVKKDYEANKENYDERPEILDYDLEYIKNLNDDECHIALQKFMGVGAKVADCIMLFSMKKKSAFPVDVWVKRAMIHFYVAPDVSLNKMRIFARDKFGKFSGMAQQYLFYYARENKIEV
ncbi:MULTISPECIES: DNA-3-methyladenine glycosylase family protein [Eubacteriales]|uniref:DNA-(apurinic or apyrimidinic site) lyase n=1 Tax=Clostridium isatidis TaxID=182773 RepID=A0A343J9R5_9CLOT|nr:MULTISPECIES: DNA glycosylase [Eubacteriales]ASW42273.1 8-oxoguanine DNA glycosylase [Clostridium isatidis]MBU5453862.1 DNA-3-methyladenine glycosylase [Caproiciproducens sp. MSJ-32]